MESNQHDILRYSCQYSVLGRYLYDNYSCKMRYFLCLMAKYFPPVTALSL